MLGPTSILLLIFIYFIFVTIFLTILWRMALALDRISDHLLEILRTKKLPLPDARVESKAPRRKQ